MPARGTSTERVEEGAAGAEGAGQSEGAVGCVVFVGKVVKNWTLKMHHAEIHESYVRWVLAFAVPERQRDAPGASPDLFRLPVGFELLEVTAHSNKSVLILHSDE
jgi:hypothetical protein